MPLAFSTGQTWSLVIVLAAIAALMLAIHLLGRYLAATHPDPVKPVAKRAQQPANEHGIPPEMLTAIIASAVHTMLKHPVRIVSISPVKPPSVERLMQQWSIEGRRAIYSSHNFR
jgi:hypothetical protein